MPSEGHNIANRCGIDADCAAWLRINVSHNDFLHLQSDKIASLNSRGLRDATHGKRTRTIESERFFNHRKGAPLRGALVSRVLTPCVGVGFRMAPPLRGCHTLRSVTSRPNAIYLMRLQTEPAGRYCVKPRMERSGMRGKGKSCSQKSESVGRCDGNEVVTITSPCGLSYFGRCRYPAFRSAPYGV